MVERKLPSLSEIRKGIPERCFQKSLPRSMFYMVRDILCWMLLLYIYPMAQASGMPAMMAWWNITGFVMWCLFVVGHDCGHGSFSHYTWINDICGHMCHAPLLVPFWPWQKSHRIHHMYHNHLSKDMSHPWFTKETWAELEPWEEAILQNPLSMFVKYTFFYLFAGKRDGSHINPASDLFTDRRERIQCAISTLTVMGAAGAVYFILGGDWRRIGNMYIIPLLIFNAWITMVTYLQIEYPISLHVYSRKQHHDEETVVFEDKEWTYVKGALQTIDRTYGMGIDQLSHNITDCHVTHHLFFTQIPHYRLAEASEAVRKLLEPTGMYKQERSFDFLWQFTNLNYKLTYLTGSGVMRYYRPEQTKSMEASIAPPPAATPVRG